MEINFYKSKEYPNYYLLYKGANGVKADKMLQKLTNTAEFENSGYEKVEIEMGFILKTDANEKFFDYLFEKVATNHIPQPLYNGQAFRAWYEFKNFEFENWVNEFNIYDNHRREEFLKATNAGTQIAMF